MRGWREQKVDPERGTALRTLHEGIKGMTASGFGYAGKILRVDLSSGRIQSEPLDADLVNKFVGGRGFSSSILFKEMRRDIEPYDENNLLVFAIGPFTGSSVPSSSRFVVASKSPATGILGDGNAGGFWGPELKHAGYDGIVIRGKSDKPVYLSIKDARVEIRDARHLWGKYTSETEKLIKEELAEPKTRIASIGPAGENLVNYACIITEAHHSARCGIGAVMGSKNLKAIAVRGTQGIRIKQELQLKDVVKELRSVITNDLDMRLFTDQGSAKYILGMNRSGSLPTRNYQTGIFEGAEKIGGTAFLKLKTRNDTCFSCPVQCKGFCTIPDGPFGGTYPIPELVTIHSLGSGCGNDNIESIIYANELCNNIGLDTVSTGRTISFILECNQRGILPREMKGDYNLEWGDYLEELKLIEEIGYRRGIGKLLSVGSLKASRVIGGDAEKYAMQSKGLELSSSDPRCSQGYGLGSATSTRGGCNLRAYANERLWTKEYAEEVFGISEIVDRTKTKGKGRFVKWSEDFSSLINSLGVCARVFDESNIANTMKKLDLLAQAFGYLTGIEKTKDELLRSGERITNIEKLFNLREGCGKEQDILPRRFLEEPLAEGPSKGQVHHLNSMIKEYYAARGWDPETSIPTKEKLKDLGLDQWI